MTPPDLFGFIPPTEAQCKGYAKEIGLPEFEGEKFFHYHESTGWLVGKRPMQKWKSALHTWRLNREGRTQPQRKAKVQLSKPVKCTL
jgi:hypothetical protein